jgi:hypothetical protein
MSNFSIPVVYSNTRDKFEVHCTLSVSTLEEPLKKHLQDLESKFNEYFGLDYTESTISIVAERRIE